MGTVENATKHLWARVRAGTGNWSRRGAGQKTLRKNIQRNFLLVKLKVVYKDSQQKPRKQNQYIEMALDDRVVYQGCGGLDSNHPFRFVCLRPLQRSSHIPSQGPFLKWSQSDARCGAPFSSSSQKKKIVLIWAQHLARSPQKQTLQTPRIMACA